MCIRDRRRPACRSADNAKGRARKRGVRGPRRGAGASTTGKRQLIRATGPAAGMPERILEATHPLWIVRITRREDRKGARGLR
eukprot:2466560-Alexandrium_andersonii.AAC.1